MSRKEYAPDNGNCEANDKSVSLFESKGSTLKLCYAPAPPPKKKKGGKRKRKRGKKGGIHGGGGGNKRSRLYLFGASKSWLANLRAS